MKEFWRKTALGLSLAFLPGRGPAAARLFALRSPDLSRFAGAPAAGVQPLNETVTVGLGLSWTDPQGLQTLLMQLYDPRDPLYRRFLSPDAFVGRFGPAPRDVRAVVDFARAHGLSVTATSSNGLIVDARADAAAVQAAFHVTLRRLRRPDGTIFRAPDRAPSVDTALPVAWISGLDTYDRPHPGLTPHPSTPPAGAHPAAGSGTGGLYRGYDFQQAYAIPSALSGTGQVLGLVEFSDYFPADIQSYESGSSPALPANTPTRILVDETQGDTSNPTSVMEVSLDIEMGVAMAPGAAVDVYEAPGGSGTDPNVSFDDMLAAMAASNPLCRQISCSWIGFGDATAAQLLQQCAAQGQGYFQASGDNGAYAPGDAIGPVPGPENLAPYETVVGGTDLTASAPGGGGALAYQSESTWDDYRSAPSGGSASGGASGGGFCVGILGTPAYQYGIPDALNQASPQWRDVPDVSIVAQGLEVISNNGQDAGVDGTSAAAPLWAAFCALANEQAALQAQPPLGFVNPALYALAATKLYGAVFHDIANGSTNDMGGTDPSAYRAVPGYDLCTGLGSPNGAALIRALALETAALGTSGSLLAPEAGSVRFVTYPNPYSPLEGQIALNFAPTNAQAVLDVFDTAYRLIITVPLDPGQAGLGKGEYCGCDGNGRPLAPGTYYAVLKAGGRPQTCKFTVRP